MDEYTCDSCGSTVLTAKNDITEAFGFHGAIQEIREHSGSAAVSWFACKDECIPAAIKAALKKAWA